MKKDLSISFIRIMAMFFIVICHIASHYEKTVFAQFFNVGVPIFFFISGYLYGRRRIDAPFSFLFKRYLRLEVPAVIWLIIVCVSSIINGKNLPELHERVFLLLNLQGLKFIFSTIKDLFIGPWFFTNIMACYILLIIYLKIEQKHELIFRIFEFGGVLPLLIFCILAINRISTDGALAFFIGFVLKRKNLTLQTKKTNIVIYMLSFAITVAFRLYCKQLIDATVVYDEIVAPLTHVILAVTIACSVMWLFSVAPSIMERITSNKFLQHLDRISIYVYICHSFIYDGTLMSIFYMKYPVYALLMVYFVLVILLSSVLWLIGKFATSKVEKGVEWLIM